MFSNNTSWWFKVVFAFVSMSDDLLYGIHQKFVTQFIREILNLFIDNLNDLVGRNEAMLYHS